MNQPTTAQTITNITNAKILELYRSVESGDPAGFDDAIRHDGHLADLSGRIIEAMDGVVVGTLKRPPGLAASDKTTNGKDKAQFIQTKLISWLDHEGLDIYRAAEAMHISEPALAAITISGAMPHINNLRQLGKYVPEIQNNLGFLLSATNQDQAG